MSNQSTASSVKSDDLILLVGRIALGAIFVKSGLQKLMALGAFTASLASRGVPQSSVWAVIGATVEFVGGILGIRGSRAARAGESILQEPVDHRRFPAAVRQRFRPVQPGLAAGAPQVTV